MGAILSIKVAAGLSTYAVGFIFVSSSNCMIKLRQILLERDFRFEKKLETAIR